MITTGNRGLLTTTLGGSPNPGEVVAVHLEKITHEEITSVAYTVVAADTTIENVATRLAAAITSSGIDAKAIGATITLRRPEHVTDWTFISTAARQAPIASRKKSGAGKH